ncbi:MAG: YegS/Rv2252/BmrU family lipid kinase [Microlunatus sp.]|nr:YegS/Rv2252/BmrU family lipid kinase [Microlunatus sp.]
MASPEAATPGRRAPSSMTLVVNPSAGKGRAQEFLPEIVGRIRDAGHELDIWLSRDYDEARALINKAANSGADVMAVMGGDGMMHLGVNESVRAQQTAPVAPSLGLIPAGTGNDLCRGLDIGTDPLAAVDVILAGTESAVDLARVGDAFIGTIVATGFDAMVNRRANDMTWPKGSARYAVALMSVLRTFEPLHYQLTIDGVRRDLDAMLVAVGNTSCYGGGIRICPDADPTDGLLDVTIIHPVGRPTLLRLMPKLYTGGFVTDPCVELVRVGSITIDGPGMVGFGDGEMIGATPLAVQQVPAVLRVCRPAA